jgi:hypothetical protein
MRRLANILALACLGLLVVALWMAGQDRALEAFSTVRTVSAVRHIEQVIKFKGTVQTVSTNQRGWPVTVDPVWFENDPPRNPLLSTEHPWLEVAGPEQAAFQHPPVRLAVNTQLAGFWYNPYQGVVRARVPVMVSDQRATALYNRVNGTNLHSILEVEQPKDEPFPHPASTANPTVQPDSPDPGAGQRAQVPSP